MNQEDLVNRGLADGDQIEICGLHGDEESHSIAGLTAVAYDIPRGSIAGYLSGIEPGDVYLISIRNRAHPHIKGYLLR